MAAFAVFFFILGLVVGSFLNVVAYRLPRHESLAFPPSHCPACWARLRPADLVPVASYLALRGRCRYCGRPISARYPLIELLTGLLFLAVFLVRGAGAGLIPGFILVALMVAVSAIDLEYRVIPNPLTFAGAGAGLAASLFRWTGVTIGQSVLGLFICGGLLFLIGLAGRGGMGGGDVKLGAVIGAFLGWGAGLLGLFLGFVLGAVVGLALIATGAKGRKDAIPFGPFLALGATLSFLWGNRLIEAYVRIWLR